MSDVPRTSDMEHLTWNRIPSSRPSSRSALPSAAVARALARPGSTGSCGVQLRGGQAHLKLAATDVGIHEATVEHNIPSFGRVAVHG